MYYGAPGPRIQESGLLASSGANVLRRYRATDPRIRALSLVRGECTTEVLSLVRGECTTEALSLVRGECATEGECTTEDEEREGEEERTLKYNKQNLTEGRGGAGKHKKTVVVCILL